jgi:hypothetical protein
MAFKAPNSMKRELLIIKCENPREKHVTKRLEKKNL